MPRPGLRLLLFLTNSQKATRQKKVNEMEEGTEHKSGATNRSERTGKRGASYTKMWNVTVQTTYAAVYTVVLSRL